MQFARRHAPFGFLNGADPGSWPSRKTTTQKKLRLSFGHPAQAVAKSHRRASSFARWQPPIQPVLNARFLLPAALDGIYYSSIFPEIKIFPQFIRLS